MSPFVRVWAYGWAAAARRVAATERGNSAVEYAMILSLVVVVCLLAVTFIGDSTGESLSSTASAID